MSYYAEVERMFEGMANGAREVCLTNLDFSDAIDIILKEYYSCALIAKQLDTIFFSAIETVDFLDYDYDDHLELHDSVFFLIVESQES